MDDVDPSFDDTFFAFLEDLRRNNDRAWFEANRDRYEHEVLEPALAFVEDFAPELERLSPHLVADPRRSGGSLFRIHRDIRFSRDKTPYKTHVGIHFRHGAGKGAHAPGLYLHLEPGSVFAGGGIWRPDGEATRKIREAIAADPGGWLALTTGPPFAERLALGGERLKRVPAGYDAESPAADDLRLKSFFGISELTQAAAVQPGFARAYGEIATAAAPLLAFLCRALGLPF